MNLEELLAGLERPKPLAPEARRRLEERLTRRDHSDDGDTLGLLRGVAGARPLSDRSRSRLELALMSAARPAAQPVWLPRAMVAVATAVAVIASALIVWREPVRPSGIDPQRIAIGRRSPEPPSFRSVETERAPVQGFENPSRSRARVFSPADNDTPVSAATPVVVTALGGDADEEAGFRAYVGQLNASGGLNGRRVEIADRADPAAVATVNLSGRPIATPDGPPSWARGPVFETVSATEDVLHGRVFSMSAAPERQAHLLVAAVFPRPTPSAVATIYRGTSGVFADAIPQALRNALQQRQVRVIEVEYEPGRVVPLAAADAEFLSLDQESTLAFLDYSRGRSYREGATIACIFPMLDTDIVERIVDGYLVLSPYSLGPSSEAAVLQRASGRGLSTGTIHGWVTAKALATALAQSEAQTPDAAVEAVRDLHGFDHGFAPPYAVREGTNSRTPEGILYQVRDGAYEPSGGFRTDTD